MGKRGMRGAPVDDAGADRGVRELVSWLSRSLRKTRSHQPPSTELVNTIETQIIPRLVMAHSPAAVVCPDGRPPPTALEVAAFADRAVLQDSSGLFAMVEDMTRDGLTLESLLLDLVAPAARFLGDQWLDDRRSFADVTLGLGSLQRVVGVLGRNVEMPLSPRGVVVLVAAPGEQHTLAIQLLGELLREAGWAAHVDPSLSETGLLDMVGSEAVEMVGITVRSREGALVLSRLVGELLRVSRNPDLRVILGGAPELAAVAPELGATYCPSAREALALLEGEGTTL